MNDPSFNVMFLNNSPPASVDRSVSFKCMILIASCSATTTAEPTAEPVLFVLLIFQTWNVEPLRKASFVVLFQVCKADALLLVVVVVVVVLVLVGVVGVVLVLMVGVEVLLAFQLCRVEPFRKASGTTCAVLLAVSFHVLRVEPFKKASGTTRAVLLAVSFHVLRVEPFKNIWDVFLLAFTLVLWWERRWMPSFTSIPFGMLVAAAEAAVAS